MVGKGFFGGLFDFDGDGKLDDFEKAADFAAFMSVLDDTGKTIMMNLRTKSAAKMIKAQMSNNLKR